MQVKTLVAAIISSAVVTWAGVLWVGGQTLGWELLKPYSLVVTVVTLFSLFFETVLWRLPLVRSVVVKRPPIAGTWRTTLESSFRQPDGQPTIKTVYVVVAQTLTTLSVRMFTDKAHSYSLAERIRPSENDDLFELAVVYQSVPDIDQRLPESTGSIHFGALLISNVPYRPQVLKGHYWTDRRTEGKLTLEERHPKLASSFSEGQALFLHSAQTSASIIGRLGALFAPSPITDNLCFSASRPRSQTM